VTVTLAIHPLVGKKLRVAATVRDLGLLRYVNVECPDGRTLRLPLEWTDRAEPRAAPLCDGREVRLSARGLLELSRAVATALDRGATSPKSEAGPGSTRQKVEPNKSTDGGDKRQSGTRGLGEDTPGGPAQRARRVGGAHPQDPPRRRKRCGAKS
jgi:hypothetical protein